MKKILILLIIINFLFLYIYTKKSSDEELLIKNIRNYAEKKINIFVECLNITDKKCSNTITTCYENNKNSMINTFKCSITECANNISFSVFLKCFINIKK